MPVAVWSRTPISVAPSFGKNGFDQFEIADGDGVENHGFGAVEIVRGIEMIERGALRVAQVVQNGSGGGDGRVLAGESAAIEGEQMEVFAQDAVGVIDAEDPGVELGDDPAFGFVDFAGSSGASAATRTSRAPMLSRRPGSSKRSSSVARNSPVETST